MENRLIQLAIVDNKIVISNFQIGVEMQNSKENKLSVVPLFENTHKVLPSVLISNNYWIHDGLKMKK